ncbi:MAG: hypothetical protein WBA97_20095 [Actinophytocola sp.]|uniref:hypothetical protein n=1 Tax=Actinophytocola sp. TaxID=1872138 RepID=UPI003C7198C5
MSNTVVSTVPHARTHGEHTGRPQAPLTGEDETYDGARRLLVEALELAGGGIPRQSRRMDPATELRDELRARTGKRVLVSCSSLADLAGLLGGDPAEVLRIEVLGQTHRLTLLHHDASATSGDDQHVLLALTAAGADVRLLAAPPPEAVLIEDDLAVLPADAGATLVRSPEVVRALRRSHQAMRAVAVDFTLLNEAMTTFIGPRLLTEVLCALCAGLKDESAARQMRISVRTYRRHVACILKVLKVTSRFEAGMRLSEIGLTGLALRRAAPGVPSWCPDGSGGAPEGVAERHDGEARQQDPYWDDIEGAEY